MHQLLCKFQPRMMSAQQPFCTPQCNTQLACGFSSLNHPATLSNLPTLLYPSSARGEQCIEVNWSLLSPCWWAAKIGKHIPNNIKLGLQKSLEVLSGWYETSLVSCQESCVHCHLSDETDISDLTSHLHKYRGGAIRWLEF